MAAPADATPTPPPPPPPPPPPVVEVAPVVVAPPPPPAAPPAATPAPAWNTVMKEELLVDTYYMLNFNGFKSGHNTLLAPGGRTFDTQSNSFTMNYAKVGLEVDADPVTVRADLGYGYLGGILTGGSGQAFVVQQAFASLKLPGTPLTLDMGRFVTSAGSEVIEANRNWLYSRSFLFGIIPFYHTGARATLKASDMVALQLTVANSQGAPDPDVNSGKVLGAQVAITPLPTTAILLTGYFGREGMQGNAGPELITLDLVASHNVSDAFGLNLNFDYIKQDTSNKVGAALMGRYVAAEHLTLAARAEFLRTKAGDGVSAVSAYEGTLGAGFPFAGHFEARAELRGDFSGDPIFPGGTVGFGGMDAGTKNQFTGTIAFLGFI